MKRDLLKNPLSKPSDIGKSIPNSKHSVCVALPEWRDVIGYEENDDRVISAMKNGYPRFFINPITQELFNICESRFAKKGEFCIAFPNKYIAEECGFYVRKFCDEKGYIYPFGKQGVYVICLPNSAKKTALEFWQHSGMIISSRQSSSLLEDKNRSDDKGAKEILEKRIADLYEEFQNNVYLFPSGMAAILSAYKGVYSISTDKKSIQIGFPYVDTLKIQQKFGNGVHILNYTDRKSLKDIKTLLESNKISAVFCEFPSNPLLRSIDLRMLSEILYDYDVPLIVDDTISTSHNVDITCCADIIVTSLTKNFSGTGNVMAGSLVLNSKSPQYGKLKPIIEGIYKYALFSEDAIVLEYNSRDFHERMDKINKTTEIVCDYLSKHNVIEKVFYPKYVNSDVYREFIKPRGGYGGLFSFVLKNTDRAPDVYDNLEVCKGPSLGTNFTLACPYTLLAHYDELEFAKKFGVSENLIRVSIGLEESDDLISRFDEALVRGNK